MGIIGMWTLSRRRIASACFLILWLAEAAFMCPASADPARVEPLRITTSTGVHELSVEVARTPEERAQGLMFRRSLPKDRGMLFDFGVEQTIFMWMKNTYISLDMIFVSRAGRVVSIAQGTQPMSERTISSGAPALAVIEVNAGTAKKMSVSVGDVVRHPIFGSAQSQP